MMISTSCAGSFRRRLSRSQSRSWLVPLRQTLIKRMTDTFGKYSVTVTVTETVECTCTHSERVS